VVVSTSRGEALTKCISIRTHRSVTVACLWTFVGRWDFFRANNIITCNTLTETFEIAGLGAFLAILTKIVVGTYTSLVFCFKDIGSFARWPDRGFAVLRAGLTNHGVVSGRGRITLLTRAFYCCNYINFASRKHFWSRCRRVFACACRSFKFGRRK
jgi:hypothetical protein